MTAPQVLDLDGDPPGGPGIVWTADDSADASWKCGLFYSATSLIVCPHFCSIEGGVPCATCPVQ